MSDEQLGNDDALSDEARAVLREVRRDGSADALGRLDAQVDVLARHRAAALTAPDLDTVEHACAALRSAAVAQADAELAADALSADRIQFLETSLEFHDRHGTQPCPVCAATPLDDGWVARARAALDAEKGAASALRVARSGAHRARQVLIALVQAVDAPAPDDAGIIEAAAARVARASFATLPADGDTALADYVAGQFDGLRAAYDALGEATSLRLRACDEARAWLREFGDQLPPNSAGSPSMPA